MVLAPELFTSYSATLLSLRTKFISPSAEHPFGTDHMGMDIFARVVYAARTTIWVVFVVLSIATGLGFIVGSLAGYVGGRLDSILMRMTDVWLAFPFACASDRPERRFRAWVVSNDVGSRLFLVAFLCAADSRPGLEREE